jgi:hypothetical protein
VYFNPNNIFPVRYHPAPPPLKFDQIVVVNWLGVEVPYYLEMEPALGKLSGWRNREVWRFVQDNKEDMWLRYGSR